MKGQRLLCPEPFRTERGRSEWRPYLLIDPLIPRAYNLQNHLPRVWESFIAINWTVYIK